MITLFTGSPGAGKTASLVDFLSKLAGDRPLYVDGLDGLKLPHLAVDTAKWHTDIPDGSILVIDEVQRVWRPRPAGSKVPDSVSQLETHRHRGIDVFMTTQAPRLLDTAVRALVGRHVHIRDTGILGRYWYEWPECNDALTWKTCINRKRISLPKKSFDLYTSASLHTVPVRGVPRALFVGIFAIILFTILAFGVYKIIQKSQNPSSSLPVNNPVTDKELGLKYQTSDKSGLIDDRVDWIPRISNRPESAPAYDHLRKVVAMPVVRGGFCIDDVCKCITDQGTDSGLSSNECLAYIKNPTFDPYRVVVVASSNERYPISPGQKTETVGQ